MHIIQILILAIVQGFAELLPISSSAHVILAEKLMGLDPTAPAMTLLLVMLHTGTMFAVIVYFWKSWRTTYFQSVKQFRANVIRLVIATGVTGVVGLALLFLIKHVVGHGNPNFEIEQLFGDTRLIAGGLAAAGVLIITSALVKRQYSSAVTLKSSVIIGFVQGLCLPFRGFSRSGATISTGLLLGVPRRISEEFSFALAVVLTPVVIAKEAYRLIKHQALSSPDVVSSLAHTFSLGLLGMVFSFLAGLAAMRWLSSWLENGKWYLFGGYCLVASLTVWSMS
ncbi:undecaprenyl-diphosphate phosphatase [Celerinatantimonas yamalensis]|uniref:Undecaprenyl-diphosphatase n=1 Tax=Celerinatantimonas yamalensis TaxID=559956 RepID=A0ABW9GAD1_9GAMM